jgi:hypothetical protein
VTQPDQGNPVLTGDSLWRREGESLCRVRATSVESVSESLIGLNVFHCTGRVPSFDFGREEAGSR